MTPFAQYLSNRQCRSASVRLTFRNQSARSSTVRLQRILHSVGKPRARCATRCSIQFNKTSLCHLCVLCVSVVVFPGDLTTETQRTPRLHREESCDHLRCGLSVEICAIRGIMPDEE